jgi:hypothetical protein
MNKLKKVISIIFVFLGIAFIIFSFVTVPNSKKDKKNDHNNVIDNKEKEIRQIGFSPAEQRALSLVPKIVRNLNGLDYYNVFQNKKINVKEVDISILIANLINLYDNKNYDGCTDSDKEINGACSYVINLNEFKEKFENTYDRKFEQVDNIKGTGVLSCKINKDHYVCSDKGGGWVANEYDFYFTAVTFSLEKGMLVQNVKAETDDEYLYIYQDYAEFRILDNDSEKNSPSDYRFKLYKYSNSDELVTNDIIKGEDYYEDSEEAQGFDTKLIIKYRDNFSNFKHTLKVYENRKYIYVSTEEIK